MLIKSDSMAEAVSKEPAPFPITVISSARSVVTVARFNVPSIANWLLCLTSLGDTFKLFLDTSLLDKSWRYFQIVFRYFSNQFDIISFLFCKFDGFKSDI